VLADKPVETIPTDQALDGTPLTSISNSVLKQGLCGCVNDVASDCMHITLCVPKERTPCGRGLFGL